MHLSRAEAVQNNIDIEVDISLAQLNHVFISHIGDEFVFQCAAHLAHMEKTPLALYILVEI